MTREEMNLIPLGFLGWLLCVTGAVIASLPQWFVVQVGRGATAASAAIEAEIIGLPILFVGSLLLIIAWLRRRSSGFRSSSSGRYCSSSRGSRRGRAGIQRSSKTR